mmetsp:Transcript_4758/g.9093  ORF Transcript_4758/g.9093 Transcript_4758/m.9093 type:complete len:146 (+) Transcript_4758:146-583(+)
MNDDTSPFEYMKSSLGETVQNHHGVRRVSNILDDDAFKSVLPNTRGQAVAAAVGPLPPTTNMRWSNRWMDLAQRAFILGVIHGHEIKLAERKAKEKKERREAAEIIMAETFGQHIDNQDVLGQDISIDSDDESFVMIQDEDLIVF